MQILSPAVMSLKAAGLSPNILYYSHHHSTHIAHSAAYTVSTNDTQAIDCTITRVLHGEVRW